MMLSDRDIRQAITDGSVVISPKPDFTKQLGSCSVDLRLGRRFRVFNYSKVSVIDANHKRASEDITAEVSVRDGEPFYLHPGDFVLATTLETVTLPADLAGRLEGRSSLGRLGIVVHSTASVVDPGFSGVIVMELGNLGRVPVALYPEMRICALTFERLSSPAAVPYGKKKSAKYANQQSPQPSRISED